MILKQLRPLLDAGMEANAFIGQAIAEKRFSIAEQLLIDLQDLVKSLRAVLAGENGRLLAQCILYCQNVDASIDKIRLDGADFKQIFTMEVSPCFLEVEHLLSLEMKFFSEGEDWDAYRAYQEAAVAKCRTLPQATHKYKVSIVLIAYNKLAYTKLAVESIYRYTDFSKGDVELITLNNGSTDGTEQYFSTLPNSKKINLRHNILPIPLRVADSSLEGKYVIYFSNDILATHHWLENLVTCMEQSNAFSVVPTCNREAIANYQGVAVNYQNTIADMENMQKFAWQYNHSNPCLWEERAVLMPFLVMYRTDWIQCLGIDPIYTQADFVDDDLSTLVRRAGFKQILAKDTFLHHFGGVSLNEGRVSRENNSLTNMAQVYYKKWGVDAWWSSARFPGREETFAWRMPRDDDTILFLEPLFGTSFLQWKNYCRRENKQIRHTTAIVLDQRYAADAAAFFDEVIAADSLEKVLAQSGQKYDLISMGRYLTDLPFTDTMEFLETLYRRLKPGGEILFPVENYGSTHMLLELLLREGQSTPGKPAQPFRGILVSELMRGLLRHPYMHQVKFYRLGYPEDDSYSQQMLTILQQFGTFSPEDLEAVRKRLNARIIYVGVFKPNTKEKME